MKQIAKRIVSIVREKDFAAKGISLLLAVILWAFIMAGKSENLRFKIPIAVKNLPAHLAVSSMSDKFATIVVEGRKEHLKSINIKNIKAVVNLEKAEPKGEKEYAVHVEKLQVPEEISLSLLTRTVNVTVEKKEEKMVRVVPVVTGAALRGKVIIDKIAVPERVKISGPKTLLDEIETVETEDISVENETGDIQRQVGLKKENLKDVVLNETIVTVKVVIVDLKDLAVVTAPITVRNGLRDFEYHLNNAEAEIYIRVQNYRRISPGEVVAFVDAGRINVPNLFAKDQRADAYRELPVVVQGKGLGAADIISVTPKKVQVRITKKQNT